MSTPRGETTIINLNDMVTVRLNDLGHKVVREYFRLIGMPIPEKWKGPEIELSIWELANLFGPHLYNGCHPPFESMNVELRRM